MHCKSQVCNLLKPLHSGIKFTSDITIFLYYYILIRNSWEAVWIVIREKSGMLAPFLISFARNYWQERVLLGTFFFFKKLNNLHLQRGAFSEYSIIVNIFLHQSRCRLGVPCMSPDDIWQFYSYFDTYQGAHELLNVVITEYCSSERGYLWYDIWKLDLKKSTSCHLFTPDKTRQFHKGYL